jgi:DNA-binding HxlR family transcriptional regulator
MWALKIPCKPKNNDNNASIKLTLHIYVLYSSKSNLYTLGEALMVQRKSFASMGCTLANALELIGDGWSMLILRDLMLGLRRFDDLQTSLQIATDTLSGRLKLLEEKGLITRRAYQDRPIRYDYVLTPKGASLSTAFMALSAWGQRWSHAPGQSQAIEFIDKISGHTVHVCPVDAVTGATVSVDQVRVVVKENADAASQWRARRARERAAERRALANS